MKKSQIAGIVSVIVIVGAVVLLMFSMRNWTESEPEQETGAAKKTAQVNDTPSDTKAVQPVATTETQLVYLIEEEKLAHDVYTVMYQKYGANVFGNILESESTHQSRVLALLQSRNIEDPRTQQVGKFNNQELQTLYDTLIAQGNESANEAYKVGVAIEEKDIADISKQLATANDDDVVATLEALRQGSENHLRAFNRQIK